MMAVTLATNIFYDNATNLALPFYYDVIHFLNNFSTLTPPPLLLTSLTLQLQRHHSHFSKTSSMTAPSSFLRHHLPSSMTSPSSSMSSQASYGRYTVPCSRYAPLARASDGFPRKGGVVSSAGWVYHPRTPARIPSYPGSNTLVPRL